MTTIQRPITFFLIFATMMVLGGIQNTKGIILDQVQHDISLDLGQVGVMVSVFQVGFLLASLVAGFLADRRGIKIVMLTGTTLMIIGLIGTSAAFDVAFFLGFYLIVGLGIGTMTVSVATMIPTFFARRAGVVFNVANAFFGIGMIITPLILNLMFARHVSWRAFYIGTAVLIAAIMLVLIMFRSPAVTPGRRSDMTLKSVGRLLSDRQVLLVVLFILFYVATEAGFLNFFPILYSSLNIPGQTEAQTTATAGYVVASFAVLFTIGRFVGGFIIYKLGERRTLIAFSVLSLAALIVGRLLIHEFAYSMMVFGFTMSVLFPTAQGLGSKLTTKFGTLQGMIYVASGVGGAIVGVVIGQVSKAVGIQLGFNLLIIFLLLVCAAAFLIKPPVDGPTRTSQIVDEAVHE